MRSRKFFKVLAVVAVVALVAFSAVIIPRISYAAGPKEYRNKDHCGERFTYKTFVQAVITGNGKFSECPSLEIEVSFRGSDIKALRWEGTGNRRQLWVELEYKVIIFEGKASGKQSPLYNLRSVEIDVQAFPDEWGERLLILEFGELRDYVVYWGTVELYTYGNSRGQVEYVEVGIIPVGCEGCLAS